MLDNFISWIGTTVLSFLIFMLLLSSFLGATKWYQLQSETQFVADTVAQYGCYTQETDTNVRGFLQAKNFPNKFTSFTVDTGGSGQAIYGEQVVVETDYPWQLMYNAWGDVLPLKWDLITYASAISTYEPSASAAYQETNQVCTVPNF